MPLFRVVIDQCSGKDLKAGDRNGLSDPYMEIDWDSGAQKFKSDVIKKTLNPEWHGFHSSFIYSLESVADLDQRFLAIKVWDWNRFRSPDFLGKLKVDLYTLATGPQSHDLPLEQGDNGRLRFRVVMEQISTVTVELGNLRTMLAQVPSGPVHVELHYREIDNLFPNGAVDKLRTGVVTPDKTGDTYWTSIDHLQFHTCYRVLLTSEIEVVVISSGKAIASANLGFAKHWIAHPDQYVEIVERLTAPGGGHAGELTCEYKLHGLPQYGQMTGGLHTENGVGGGKACVWGLPVPFGAEGAASQPPKPKFGKRQPGWATNVPTPPTQTTPSRPKREDSFKGGFGLTLDFGGISLGPSFNLGASTSAPAPPAKPKAPASTPGSSLSLPGGGLPPPGPSSGSLPEFWEERKDPKTGRMFFVDHTTGTTTWIDPRTGQPTPIPRRRSRSRSPVRPAGPPGGSAMAYPGGGGAWHGGQATPPPQYAFRR